MNRSLQWRKFTFFDKDVVCENVEVSLGSRPTCATAESGMLLFGDAAGYISIADRSFQFDRKCKAFRGEVRGVRYLVDGANHRRQFVFAVGDDSRSAEGAALSGADNLNPFGSGVSSSSAAPAGNAQYVIKIFNMNDLARPIHAFHANAGVAADATVTSFTTLPDGSQVAVGYSNSAVLLFAAPFLKSDSPPIRQLVPVVLAQPEGPEQQHHSKSSTTQSSSSSSSSSSASVSGLHFCLLPTQPTPTAAAASSGDASSTGAPAAAPRRTRLFATFSTQPHRSSSGTNAGGSGGATGPSHDGGGVVVYDTTGLGLGLPSSASVTLNHLNQVTRRAPVVLDEVGCAAGCSSLMPETLELVVGRDEGVFSYSVEDRGGAAGFEGEKQCVVSVGRYILVSVLDDKVSEWVGD